MGLANRPMHGEVMGTSPLVALVFLFLALGPSAARSEDPQGKNAPSCYAVLYIVFPQSQIFLDCNGQRQRIPTGGHVTKFAVDQDGSTLALTRMRFRIEGRTAVAINDLGVLDLRGQGSMRVSLDHGGDLRATCGTVVMFEGSTAHDLINGSELRMKPYRHFRCSSDRKIGAGVKKRTSHDLVVGSPPQRRVIRRVPKMPFDLSPNGRYLAYVPSYTGLCVADLQAQTYCTNLSWAPWDLSVSDEGEVMFTASSAEPGYWRPGQRSATHVQAPGVDAQWLTPRAAAALLGWSAARGSPQWPTNWSTPEFVLIPSIAPTVPWPPPQ